MNDLKIKHLEFIQQAINRMANCSFLLKGWAISIIAALLAYNLTCPSEKILWISTTLLLAFAWLDSYYLYQERNMRKLYDEVRLTDENLQFTMNTSHLLNLKSRLLAFTSGSVLVFYMGLIITQLLIIKIN